VRADYGAEFLQPDLFIYVAVMSTDDDEKLTLWRLSILVDRIYAIHQRGKSLFPEPVASSRIADVDKKLGSFPVTHAVERLLAVSEDNLHAVALLFREAQALQPYAPYTLIRASLENTGTAMWLLSGGSRQGIALNSLRLEWENKKNHDSASSKPVGNKNECTLRRERLLLEAGNRFGLNPKAIKEKPLSSTVVSVGSKYFGLSPVMLSAWKGSSGAAHGRTWATLALSDHDPIPGTENELGASYWATSNTSTLVSLLFVGVAAHEALEMGYTALLDGRTGHLKIVTEQAIARVYTECRIGEDAP
jgi:hypothetical protein